MNEINVALTLHEIVTLEDALYLLRREEDYSYYKSDALAIEAKLEEAKERIQNV